MWIPKARRAALRLPNSPISPPPLTARPGGAPPSSRSGFGMVLHKRRLVVFGGVHDEDTPDGEGLVSTFFNDLQPSRP